MAKKVSGANAQLDKAAVQASQHGRVALSKAWNPPKVGDPPTAGPYPGGAALHAVLPRLDAEHGRYPTVGRFQALERTARPFGEACNSL
eukprot:10578997-Alexandrium_andersonii.AAC.1